MSSAGLPVSQTSTKMSGAKSPPTSPSLRTGEELDQLVGKHKVKSTLANGRFELPTTFSAPIETLIAEVFPSDESIDSRNFSTVDYINSIFPSEKFLTDIDMAINTMKIAINQTDEEILKSVRTQVTNITGGQDQLKDVQKSVAGLFSKINDIKTKAEVSEKMVTDISRDIRAFDYAKKNLTSTITSLKRLQLLVNAVDQLKGLSAQKQYQQAGPLLEAVNQLDEHFADYKQIPKVSELHATVTDLKEQLRKDLYEDFGMFAQNPAASGANLVGSFTLIEALSKTSKKDFMIWFVNQQLSEYNRFFRAGEEAAKLGSIERRFDWLKKALLIYDEQYRKLFPPPWKMNELICEEFCFTTRQNMTDYLELNRKTLDADILISGMTKTIAFEKELGELFVEFVEQPTQPPPEEEKPEENAAVAANPYSIEAVQNRYKKFAKQKKEQEVPAEKKVQRVNKFKGIISSCFELYMNLYIDKEDTNLRETLRSLMEEETWTANDERTKILNSSTKLIETFNKRTRLCKSLTRNEALYDLFNLFKKYLAEYANLLAAKIPSGKVSEKDETVLCLIVNTTEYIRTNTEAMTSAFKTLINPKFAEKIDLSKEQTDFDNVAVKAMTALVSRLLSRAHPALHALSRIQWATIEIVGDQSDYVNTLGAALIGCVTNLSNLLTNETNFKFVLDSFCREVFIPALINAIFEAKRVNEIGAQQLMLDANAIKSLLLDLPGIGKQKGAASRQYTKIVTKGMSRVEILLKLVGVTPVESLVESYKTMIENPNETEFVKMLELKGLNRNDQKILMDKYGGKFKKILTDVFSSPIN
eukprot:TRINITY_DN6415_c0_g2_i2.p1 TRINITY_DN6415_c0_g2~~TRINITY_DN6415_c0_g2_i2.p1  ORF type:complete len:816 (-),score=248.73 TRINITY_DN6415_c0_g2_i2:14-2461(-)